MQYLVLVLVLELYSSTKSRYLYLYLYLDLKYLYLYSYLSLSTCNFTSTCQYIVHTYSILSPQNNIVGLQYILGFVNNSTNVLFNVPQTSQTFTDESTQNSSNPPPSKKSRLLKTETCHSTTASDAGVQLTNYLKIACDYSESFNCLEFWHLHRKDLNQLFFSCTFVLSAYLLLAHLLNVCSVRVD